MVRILVLAAVLLVVAGTARAGLFDTFNRVLESGGSLPAPAASQLSDGEVGEGLVEALRIGSERAVASGSQAGGFWNNELIRIVMPGPLKSAGDLLRRLGMGAPVDAFEQSMNQAAERASAESLPVLKQAIAELTFDDVRRIWQGGDTAATDYFRAKTREPLAVRYKPIVHGAMEEVGVTRSYQEMMSKPAVAPLAMGTSVDLDQYVTEKALDGLYTLLGEEEKKIRTNPVARSTEILQKVFGR